MEKAAIRRKTLLIVVLCFLGAVGILAGAIAVIRALWMADSREVVQDAAQYESVLGAEGKYKSNYLGYNSVFPDALPASAQVEEFYYEYYNPWDANYFGYLVYTCNDDDFAKERARLSAVTSTDNALVYGATGFPYELCAAMANAYDGIIYALADEAHNRMVYVGLEFCNYFTDIDYESVVDEKYLPVGFDAASGNAVQSAYEAMRNSAAVPEDAAAGRTDF